MDPRERDELRTLQERLYGPGADLQPDGEAAARLRQLTGQTSADDALAGPVRRGARHTAARDAVPADDGVEDTDTDGDDLDAQADTPPSAARRWRPSRPVAILWASSLVLAVLITIAATSALLPERLSLDAFAEGASTIAVLEVDPDFEVPGLFSDGPGNGEAAGFEEFSGVRAIVATGGYGFSTGTEDQVCLTIVVSADLGTATEYSFDGTLYVGCSANAFPASVQFMVTEEMPAEIRDVFPAGTALRFDYDERNDDIVVSTSND
ncbi:hypothetical protein [Labedella endophytica]|uniref:Uncharacterized protein n=1 Tax=Labedella endophytica TaxID=1523160 RepID=A0A433JMP9_9MICO|nr:hypothetical protein [Labedella endophytica]RUQ96897.1 hypothetical protein ELQ94_16750 [Labedella endophytica]